MPLAVGIKPDTLEFNLYDGDPFLAVMALNDGQPWPEGAVVQFRFPEADPVVVWSATVEGVDATFDQPAADVAARSHDELVEYRVNGITEAIGRVTMRNRD